MPIDVSSRMVRRIVEAGYDGRHTSPRCDGCDGCDRCDGCDGLGFGIDLELRVGVSLSSHRTRNRQALDQLYAESYTAFDTSGGMRTKADLLKALPTDAEMAEGRYDRTRVRWWGIIAVAAGHGRMVYRNADGSNRVSEYDSVNVFEQRDGKWWYVAAFLP